MDTAVAIKDELIRDMIFTFRNVQVMIDADLAILYGVETKVLNQAVKRNFSRFPEGFRLQLSKAEKMELVTNCDRFSTLKHSTSLPYAFSEQGVAMLSAVLRSERAIQTSIRIINAFVEMRHYIAANGGMLQRFDTLEKRQLSHEISSDERFEQIFNALEERSITPAQGIFFNGQIFDAYTFAADLVRSANKSIKLIDNYVDDTVLTLFAKRKKGVAVMIYTKTISKQLLLDLQQHNAQHPGVEVKKLTQAHDRFLVIDDAHLYHFGASLKDLGKKWFAFSKMNNMTADVLKRLGGQE